jgi:hypothetical protein
MFNKEAYDKINEEFKKFYSKYNSDFNNNAHSNNKDYEKNYKGVLNVFAARWCKEVFNIVLDVPVTFTNDLPNNILGRFSYDHKTNKAVKVVIKQGLSDKKLVYVLIRGLTQYCLFQLNLPFGNDEQYFKEALNQVTQDRFLLKGVNYLKYLQGKGA